MAAWLRGKDAEEEGRDMAGYLRTAILLAGLTALFIGIG